MTESDERLMDRVRDGDEAAFAGLMERHRPAVVSFLRALFHDPGRAEDGAQETFLRLWLARERYQATAPLRAYLFTIARNVFRNRLRDEPSFCALDEELTEPLPPLPEHLLVARYRLWRIRRAVAALPPHYREVFVLAQFEELSYPEVAVILEIPVGTVKSRMHAAYRLLRERLPAELWET